jgi:hypothetical protein
MEPLLEVSGRTHDVRFGRPWLLFGMVALPIVSMTIYLLWIWPRPTGASFLAQTGPYLLSLFTGAPFALLLARGPRRVVVLLVYLIAGFVLLWIYALAMLCGVRGVCL